MSEEPIHFAGTLDPRLYRRAYWLGLWGTPIPWLMIGISVVLLGAGAVSLAIREWVSAAVYGGAGLFGALNLALQELGVRRTWKSYRLARERGEGQLDEDGLHTRWEHGEGMIPWDRFHQAKVYRQVVLVYTSATQYLIVAREHFTSDEDWRAAQEIVARKVPAAPKLRWRRVVWAVLVAAVVIFVALVTIGRWTLG